MAKNEERIRKAELQVTIGQRRLIIQALKDFGKGRRLPEGVTPRDLIEAGRRF